MELAQLWQCPVSLCSVWKGTAQDCVDHMRRVHDIPPLVKAVNLARWFPSWTVTREQWYSMSRPAISGIAVEVWILCCSVAFGCRCSTDIGFFIFREHMGFSVALTCDGCILFWRSQMRCRYVGVIVDVLRTLQHGCHGHLFGMRRTGRQMFLLDQKYLVDRFPGPGGLPRRRQWPAHRGPRGLFALIIQRGILFKL